MWVSHGDVVKIQLSPVHTGDKVEFNTVDFVEIRQSQPCRFGPVHIGDNFEKRSTFGRQTDFFADLSTVSATVDFVASMYRALDTRVTYAYYAVSERHEGLADMDENMMLSA